MQDLVFHNDQCKELLLLLVTYKKAGERPSDTNLSLPFCFVLLLHPCQLRLHEPGTAESENKDQNMHRVGVGVTGSVLQHSRVEDQSFAVFSSYLNLDNPFRITPGDENRDQRENIPAKRRDSTLPFIVSGVACCPSGRSCSLTPEVD